MKAFQQNLLRWFAKNQRPLPWRGRYEPYRVWISEMMLQQTQMNTVLPYYERWMRELPDIPSLAKASPDRVLKLWEGLGYYSRARNLHASAKRIMDEFGGRFPREFDAIRSLKGVGPYSAGAIASIAFNEDRPIVDGNVLRVLSRIFAVKDPIDIPKNRGRFWKLQADLIPSGHARDFNQGLMELGALVCAPQDPGCAVCPVSAHCRAFKEGSPERYPFRAKKKKLVRVHAVAVVLTHKTGYYLHRRPAGAIMGGLWEFPEWKVSKGSLLPRPKTRQRAAALLERDLGISAKDLTWLGAIKRNYTNHLETLDVFRAKAPDTEIRDGWSGVWAARAAFKRYPFSSAHAKIARLLTRAAETE